MEPLPFSYARGIAPMMWAFVALASIELLVVHFLLSFWSRTAAIVLSLMTLGSIVWLVGVLRSFGRLPVLVGNDDVLLRIGTLKTVMVPASRVAGVRTAFGSEAVKPRSVLNLALIGYPNVVVDLTEPLPGRRSIVSIAHCLDDPAGFRSAVERLLPVRAGG